MCDWSNDIRHNQKHIFTRAGICDIMKYNIGGYMDASKIVNIIKPSNGLEESQYKSQKEIDTRNKREPLTDHIPSQPVPEESTEKEASVKRTANDKSYYESRKEDINKQRQALSTGAGKQKDIAQDERKKASKALTEAHHKRYTISPAGAQKDSISWIGDEFVKEVNGEYEVKGPLQNAISYYVKGKTDKIKPEFLEYLDDVTQGTAISERDQAVLRQIDRYKGEGEFKPLEEAKAAAGARSKEASQKYAKEKSKIDRAEERLAKEHRGRQAEVIPFQKLVTDSEGVNFMEDVPDVYFVRVHKNFDAGPNVNYIVKKDVSPAGIPVMKMFTAAKRYSKSDEADIDKKVQGKRKGVELKDLRTMVKNSLEGKPVAVFGMKDWQNQAQSYAESMLLSADKQKAVRGMSDKGQAISRNDTRDFDNIFKRVNSGEATLEDIQEAFPQKWEDKDALMSFIDKMGGAVGSDGKVYSSKALISLVNRGKAEGDQITIVEPGFRLGKMPVNISNDRVSQDDEYIWNKYFMDKNIVAVQPEDSEDNGYWDIEDKAKFVKKMLKANPNVIIDEEGNITQDHDHDYLNWTDQYQYETPNEKYRKLSMPVADPEKGWKLDEETGVWKKRLTSNVPVPMRKWSDEKKEAYANKVQEKVDKLRGKNAEALNKGIARQIKEMTGEDATAEEIENQKSRDIGIKALSNPETELDRTLSTESHELAVKVTEKFRKLQNDWGTGIGETLDKILRSDPEGKKPFVQALWKLTDELAEAHGKDKTQYTELDAITELITKGQANKANAAEEYRTLNEFQTKDTDPLARLAKLGVFRGRTN